MPYEAPVETELVAEEQGGKRLLGGSGRRTAFREEGRSRAKLITVRFGARKLPALDFEGRRLNLSKPGDRSWREAIWEWLNPHLRRRIWRAGQAEHAEIQDIGKKGDFVEGSFRLGGERYVVDKPLYVPLLRSYWDPIRITRGRETVGLIEPSPASRREWIIRPKQPVRLDALMVAYHLAGWLPGPKNAIRGGTPYRMGVTLLGIYAAGYLTFAATDLGSGYLLESHVLPFVFLASLVAFGWWWVYLFHKLGRTQTAGSVGGLLGRAGVLFGIGIRGGGGFSGGIGGDGGGG